LLMTRIPSLLLKRDRKVETAATWPQPHASADLPHDQDDDLDFDVPRASVEDATPQSPAKSEGLMAWIADRLLSATSTIRLSGSTTHIYARVVSGVHTNRAQMENFSPPTMGEFSLRCAAKWLIFKPRFEARGQFVITPEGTHTPTHTVALRMRLPLLPVLPWLVLACLPALAAVLTGRIIGYPLEGAAAGVALMALAATPLILSYAKTCKALAASLNKALFTSINAQTLDTAQARSSRVDLVPARPAQTIVELQDTDTEAEAALIARMTPKPVAVARPQKAPERAPEKASEKTVAKAPEVKTPEEKAPEKSASRSSKTVYKRKPIAYIPDAQALVKARMQAQLDAQLAALDKAEIELGAQPSPARPTAAPAEPEIVPHTLQPRKETVAARLAALPPLPEPSPSSRVGSRIKKFRTRYEAGARPEAAAELASSIVEKPQTTAPAEPDGAPQQKRTLGV
jgi:hypothetical protein